MLFQVLYIYCFKNFIPSPSQLKKKKKLVPLVFILYRILQNIPRYFLVSEFYVNEVQNTVLMFHIQTKTYRICL